MFFRLQVFNFVYIFPRSAAFENNIINSYTWILFCFFFTTLLARDKSKTPRVGLWNARLIACRLERQIYKCLPLNLIIRGSCVNTCIIRDSFFLRQPWWTAVKCAKKRNPIESFIQIAKNILKIPFFFFYKGFIVFIN